MARRVGDKSVLCQALFGLVTDHILEGNLTVAAPVVEEALAEARAIGSVTHIFLSLLQLVIISCYQRDLVRAKEYCFQTLAFARETGSSQWLLFVPFGFGLAASFGGQPRRGARLLAAAETFFLQRGIKIRDTGMRDLLIVKQALERAQQLDLAAFEAALQEGRAMTLEQALALATENEGEDSQLPKDGLGSSSDA